jgi:hypothetical protein
MALEDARIILQHFIDKYTFGIEVKAIDDMYDWDFVMLEISFYENAVSICNQYAFEPDMTDYDRFLDAHYVREIGAWSTAMHAINRALPVTQAHAFESIGSFPFHVAIGFNVIAFGDEWKSMSKSMRNLLGQAVHGVILLDELDTNADPFIDVTE